MRPRITLFQPRRVTARSAGSNTLVNRNAAQAWAHRSHTTQLLHTAVSRVSTINTVSTAVSRVSAVSTVSTVSAVSQYSQHSQLVQSVQSEYVAQHGLDTPLHVELLRESLFSSLLILGNLLALNAEATAAPTGIYGV